jgi:hypothetical protein
LIKKIARIAGAASVQQGNVIGPLVNALVPWDLYFAYRFNQCKEVARAHLPVWLETWYDLEALNALANFGYMNPDGVFPTLSLRQRAQRRRFLARDTAPLAAGRDPGRKRFHLSVWRWSSSPALTCLGRARFCVPWGDLCLAFSGAPVQASAWRSMPFRLFTCITVSDSVTDGMSYFYAEVRRLKALLDALHETHPYPLFFLIDKFSWTNNLAHIGSRAIFRHNQGYGAGIV